MKIGAGSARDGIVRCNTERAVNFNLDAVVQVYMKTLHKMGFSKDFFFCLETAVWVLTGVSRKWELRGVLDKEQEGAVSSL